MRIEAASYHCTILTPLIILCAAILGVAIYDTFQIHRLWQLKILMIGKMKQMFPSLWNMLEVCPAVVKILPLCIKYMSHQGRKRELFFPTILSSIYSNLLWQKKAVRMSSSFSLEITCNQTSLFHIFTSFWSVSGLIVPGFSTLVNFSTKVEVFLSASFKYILRFH